MTVSEYYFDNMLTDQFSDFSGDANASDGDIGTYAFSVAGNGIYAGPLFGIGTTAPASGDAISKVEVRMYATSGSVNSAAKYSIYDQTLTEVLLTGAEYTTLIGWTPWVEVTTAPSTGWDWDEITNLAGNLNAKQMDSWQSRIAKLSIRVTSSTPSPPSAGASVVLGANSYFSIATTASPASYVTIAEVLSIGAVGSTATEVDTTKMNSVAMEYTAGIISGNSIEIVMNFITANEQHQLIRDGVGVKHNVKVVWPDASMATFQFTQIGFNRDESVPQSQLKASVTGRINGDITWA
jgi:hypothetical protein